MSRSKRERAFLMDMFGGGARFTGPYDGVTFAAAYGVRRLLTAYTGDCMLLRRSTDDVELAFGFTSAGVLDTAAITAWLAGGTGYVKTWYDQSGNGRNVSQTTKASQPALNLTGLSSKPALVSGSLALGTTSGQWFTATQATAFEVSLIPTGQFPSPFSRNRGFSIFQIDRSSSARRQIYTGDGTNSSNSNSAVNGFPDAVAFIGTYVVDGTAVAYFNGGVAKGTGTHVNQITDSAESGDTIRAQHGGIMSELLVYDGVLSDAQVNVIGGSMGAYYGLSWTNFT